MRFTLDSFEAFSRRRLRRAYTIPEVMVSAAILGIMATSLFTGLAQSLRMMRATRETLRATQILQERMEIIRLYTWDQINSNGFIPRTFTTTYFPADTQSTGGLTYTGQITIANAPMTESYSNAHKLITLQLTWNSSGMARQASMSTLISEYGLHNYYYHLYGN